MDYQEEERGSLDMKRSGGQTSFLVLVYALQLTLKFVFEDVFSDPMVIKSSFSDCFPQFLGEPSSFELPQYIKHLAFGFAKHGWNVVVSNHQGLGGVSITRMPEQSLIISIISTRRLLYFAIGTSIGAKILVKYLGEDREKVPVTGAVAVCSPWDLVIGDRFICHRLLQKLYDRAIAIGLQGYAKMHDPRYSQLVNWEGIKKDLTLRWFILLAFNSRIRFEISITLLHALLEKLRISSSSPYVQNVSVQLLCIGSLDDPICAREDIPWDECRANKNIVLATSRHGGHLAFFEGITASRLCSLDAFADRDFSTGGLDGIIVDQGPYVNIAEDRMVAAVGKRACGKQSSRTLRQVRNIHDKTVVLASEQKQQLAEGKSEVAGSSICEVSGESSSLQRIKSFDVIVRQKDG
ncbi:hypothetical protein F3Y22_tig00110198pilonHSYRG00102 [Hibiscus syriacus]|uniref:Uncharacterized protein n=1 Tax=Hibiscus syriacus TaxID=106335 RepID=A0A6A3BGY8_HIBSY|nr:hypothetical protein F3Y22_tig00110198pilonHSYRG00102 [Hibiscus syriacus]